MLSCRFVDHSVEASPCGTKATSCAAARRPHAIAVIVTLEIALKCRELRNDDDIACLKHCILIQVLPLDYFPVVEWKRVLPATGAAQNNDSVG